VTADLFGVELNPPFQTMRARSERPIMIAFEIALADEEILSWPPQEIE
jgi:hypothetical protein